MNNLYHLLNECNIGKKYYIITQTGRFFIEKKGTNNFKKDHNLQSSIVSFKYVFKDIENIKYIYEYNLGKRVYPEIKLKRSNSI